MCCVFVIGGIGFVGLNFVDVLFVCGIEVCVMCCVCSFMIFVKCCLVELVDVFFGDFVVFVFVMCGCDVVFVVGVYYLCYLIYCVWEIVIGIV